jgi:hypothetical protein
MREFTKSTISFSWVLSLFGLKQMANMLAPPQQGGDHPATNAFDEVTRCASDQLGQTLRATFQAGDRAQRGLVDMMFGLFAWPINPRAGGWTPDPWRVTEDPARDGGPTARSATSWTRGARGSDEARRDSGGTCCGTGGSGQWRDSTTPTGAADSGWGPVPPAGGWTGSRREL